MRKVYSHFNPAPMKYEQNSGVSLTEPDQSMTLDEIIQAFMEGVQMEPDSDALFDGDDDLEPESVRNFDDIFDAMDSAPERDEEPVSASPGSSMDPDRLEKESEKEPEKEPES